MVDIIKSGLTVAPDTAPTGNPDVVVLLDASGSMQGQRESVVSTFNEFVESVKEAAHSISLYMFDSNGIMEKIHKENPSRIRKMTLKDYVPGLLTPLYDAMGKVMSQFEDSDRNVQFVTHTDGLENSSVEWNYEKLKEYIAILTKKGWLFVYLGEGMEGKAELSKFKGVKMNFSPENRDQTMRGLVGATASYAATASNDMHVYTNNLDGVIDVDKGETVKPWVQKRSVTPDP